MSEPRRHRAAAAPAAAEALPKTRFDFLPLALVAVLALAAWPAGRLDARPGSRSPSPAWRWA